MLYLLQVKSLIETIAHDSNTLERSIILRKQIYLNGIP